MRAGIQFVSAGGALWAHGLTLINYKGASISKYVCLTTKIDSLEKSSNFKFLMRYNDVITVMSHHIFHESCIICEVY